MQISLSLLNMLNALIAVILLFLFLRRFVFPPVLKAMQERQARIQGDLEAAEAQRREAEKLRQDLEQQLKEVRQKAEAALARALRDAEEESQQILERARAEARRIIADAETEIQAERERALEAVKRQVADLAVEIAERVLAERLSAEQDRRLFEQFVEQLGTPS
ncbi:MAG: F0F1 ATP synthase subunit B [Actinomycetia bacterium]|jgi:F-type H+-transporting ATPase subunit b|nr:F0F1 ATP synthase subunit B [Actinomycetes bacterium]